MGSTTTLDFTTSPIPPVAPNWKLITTTLTRRLGQTSISPCRVIRSQKLDYSRLRILIPGIYNESSLGKFVIQNFGCRATQADGAALQSLLAAKGLDPAGRRIAADLVVLNTCTVTASADEDVRQTIRRVHRENPAARILVTGCYAQRAPEELASMAGVEWVVGNSHKTQIAEIVTAAPYHGNIHIGDIFEQRDFLSAPVEDAAGDRTRPNLKIQDGCNNRCSFCIIPFVRGRSRSAPAEQVVEQVRGLARRYREVVLSGINLGRWGRERGSPTRLAGLVRRLL